MDKHGRSFIFRLKDISESIIKIQEYIKPFKNEDEFEKNSLHVDAVERNLEIIGESATHLPDDIKQNTNLDWVNISNYRNIVSHKYFSIDNQITWNIAIYDIPELKIEIEKLIKFHDNDLNKKFRDYIKKGDIKEIKNCLERGAKVAAVDKMDLKGLTPEQSKEVINILALYMTKEELQKKNSHFTDFNSSNQKFKL